MPAAAVTPAPRAYISVVAVKKFVVDFRGSLTHIALECCVRRFLCFSIMRAGD